MAKVLLLVITVFYVFVSTFYFFKVEGKNKKYLAISTILSVIAVFLASIN